MTTKTPKKLLIQAKLKVCGIFYEAKGKTVEDVLNNFKLPTAKSIAVLTMTKGDKERIKVLQPNLVIGLWGKTSRTRKTFALKYIKALLKDFDE